MRILLLRLNLAE